MSEGNNPLDALTQTVAQWSEFWRSAAGSSGAMGEAWSKSVLPFVLARAAESRSGAGNELADAIERMAQGPRLADVMDFDRKLLSAFSAWSEMQRKLAAYNVIAGRPWMRAAELYRSTVSSAPGEAAEEEGWRDRLGAWNTVVNDELIRNQRSEDFLAAQKELLRAATEFRARQTEINETITKIVGLPTQRDFDDVTRQLTELRRELRALSRHVGPADAAPPASGPVTAERPQASAAHPETNGGDGQ
jgi:hypothetical protein